MDELPAENVYLLTDVEPCKQDANEKGQVLYYSLSVGWHVAYYARSHMPDVTHWTYLPECPPAQESPAERLDRSFDKWVSRTFPKAEPAARTLLRLGYEAGYQADE